MPRFQGIPIEQGGRFGGQTIQEREKLSREMTHPVQENVSRETRATRELPELGSGGLLAGEDPAKIAAISPILLATTDPTEIAQILDSQFPSIGIQQDERGNLIAGNNKTGVKVVLNKPGLSKLDILQGLGIIAAFTPAGRVATAGTAGAKAGVKMALQRGAQGGLAAAGTEATIQGAQEAAGGEFSPGEVALAGGLGFAAEAGLPAIQSARRARQARKLRVGSKELKEIKPAIQEAKEAQKGIQKITGEEVPLYRGQQTLIPSQLEEQSFVQSLSPGAMRARKGLLRQNEQVGKAVDNFLDNISSPKAMEIGEGRIRSIAQSRKEALEALREQKTSPLYRQVFQNAEKQGINANVDDIVKTIERELIDAPDGSTLKRSLSKVKTFLKPGKTKSNLKRLQNAKFEIDKMLAARGDDAVAKTTQGKLIQIKRDLVDRIEEASPGYKAANETFSELTSPIKRYEESLLGQIADIPDKQLKTISGKLFDPSQTNPLVIKQARKVIDNENAWNQILRVELEKRLGKIRGDLSKLSRGEGTSIENIPGQLRRAIFGNRKQKNVLMAGLSTEQKKNFEYLDTLLTRASLGRGVGSQTATREEIKKRLNRNVGGAVVDFLRRPLETIRGVGEERMFDNRVRALADLVFDPKWQPRLEKVRKMTADSPAAIRAMTQLLNDIEEEQ
jgi:hypothetical protein